MWGNCPISKLKIIPKLNDRVMLYKTYSDKGLKIQKVGTDEIYDEAIDVENALFVYEETDQALERILAGQ